MPPKIAAPVSAKIIDSTAAAKIVTSNRPLDCAYMEVPDRKEGLFMI
jgi:hypothetical protein